MQFLVRVPPTEGCSPSASCWVEGERRAPSVLFKQESEMISELAESSMPEMVIHATSKTIYALIVPGDSGGAIVNHATQALPVAPATAIPFVPESIISALCEAIEAT